MADVIPRDIIDVISEKRLPPWDPLHIKVAPTGAAISRKQSPYLPYTPDEIIRETIASYQAGASAVHLHMRDDTGTPTTDLKIFGRVVKAIKEKCPDIIFDIPSVIGATEEEKLRPLTIPEVETTPLQPGPMIVGMAAVIRTPQQIEMALDFMLERNIVPEIAIHDLSHLANAERLIIPKIQKPYYFNIVLGLEGSTYATPANLLHTIERLPAGSKWMLTVAGRATLDMLAIAIILGGHVRVGMEDMVYLYGRQDEIIKSNVQIVAKMVEIAKAMNRDIATPAQARQIFGFKKGPQKESKR
jgi:3-keto-5-aminohexanoate cleavage enzyme